jgi:uncharacterized membrane protein YqiK
VGGLLVLVAVLVAVILIITTVFAKNYVKVPKNKVAVFTGRGDATIVNGGARFSDAAARAGQRHVDRAVSTSRRRSSTSSPRTNGNRRNS